MAELPGFLSPATWIVKVMAWSQKPFTEFPGRRRREWQAGGGMTLEFLLGWHTRGQGQQHRLSCMSPGPFSGRTSQVLWGSEDHREGMYSRRSFSQLPSVCIPLWDHSKGRGRVAALWRSRSLSSGCSKEGAAMSFTFLPNKGKKKNPNPPQGYI